MPVIIAVGAHPDDIELGCGAFIAHIIGQTEILSVTLSDNQKNSSLSNVVSEHFNSMSVLGIPQDHIIVGIVRHGYAIGDEILRPAQVAVGRTADSA